jgi:hypothetical protein
MIHTTVFAEKFCVPVFGSVLKKMTFQKDAPNLTKKLCQCFRKSNKMWCCEELKAAVSASGTGHRCNPQHPVVRAASRLAAMQK